MKVRVIEIINKNVFIGEDDYITVKFDNGMYGAINKVYVNENGKLTKELNGLEMNMKKTLEEVYNSLMFRCKVNFWVSYGLSIEEACIRAVVEMRKIKE